MAATDRPSDAGPARDSTPRARGRRRLPRGRGPLPFVLGSALPVGALAWWFTRPAAARQAFLDGIPRGVGTRVATAGLALALLVVLARVVLPGARAAGQGLARARAWIRGRRTGARLALAPLALVVEFLWIATQILYAVDAIAVLVTGAAFLVYVARIVRPELLPSLPG